MRILVVNAGSSSLKLSVLDDRDAVVAAESLPDPGVAAGALFRFVSEAGSIDAIGHRIVHGGAEFTGPVLIDPAVRDRLRALGDLAPLHQAAALRALDAVGEALEARDDTRGVPSIACFDTAFHAGMPAAAAVYAIPGRWRRRWGIRRFGFHGLSHAYAARRTAELAGAPATELRVVTCHLGAGASLAAVRGGRSVDTTMGFTPLEGLVMATRSGSVDPGLVLWLITHAGLDPGEVADGLEHESGLLALAGTGDMRALVERSARGDEDAELALEAYVHRLRGAIAAMAAAMGGLDALTFTGGVGENSELVRQRAAEGLGFLGISVSPQLDQPEVVDRRISSEDAPVQAFVVKAREDLQIAREVRSLLR